MFSHGADLVDKRGHQLDVNNISPLGRRWLYDFAQVGFEKLTKNK